MDFGLAGMHGEPAVLHVEAGLRADRDHVTLRTMSHMEQIVLGNM